MFEYFLEHPQEICIKLYEHVYLAMSALSLAICLGVPLGLLSWCYQKFGNFILAFVNVVQTIPSLAFFGLMIPLPFIGGIGAKPAILVLFFYSLLPIVKNTNLGLRSVSPTLIEAARGIGMTPMQQLGIVIIPDAFRVIMGGIRLSAVQIMGTVTLAAIIGAGGLGDLIYRGTATVNYSLIIAGTLPAILLAIVTDRFLEILEKRVKICSLMRLLVLNASKRVWLAIISVSLFVFFGAVVTVYHVFIPSRKEVVIGVKNTTESRILSEMVKCRLERATETAVRTIQLSSTSLAFQALRHGYIDLYLEYSGTIYSSFFKNRGKVNAQEVNSIVKDFLIKNFHIRSHSSLGFNNTYALAVRKEMAEKLSLRNISDLIKCASLLRIGTTSEFHDRLDGLRGLKELYGFSFKEERILDPGLRYCALASHDIDVIDAFTTDGLLLAHNFQLLEDSDRFFPPYYAIFLTNEKSYKNHPYVESAIQDFENSIDDLTMRDFNYRVDVQKQSIEDVARELLDKISLPA